MICLSYADKRKHVTRPCDLCIDPVIGIVVIKGVILMSPLKKCVIYLMSPFEIVGVFAVHSG